MKVLQLAYKVPFPQHDGGSYSIYNSANTMLEAGMKVKTLAMNTPKDWVDTTAVYTDFQRDTRFEWVYTDTRVKPGRALFNLLKKESYFTERFFSHAYEQKLIDVLLRNRFDVVVLEHLYLCQYIEIIRAYSDAKIILRAQNIEHRIWEKYISGLKNPFTKLFLKIATKRLKNYECSIVKELDGVIALTADDAAFFKYKAPHIPVTEIPVGFADSDYTPTANTTPVLFHLGSMDWMPNVEGVDWFMDHVLPIIAKKYPGIKFHIAGKKMPEWYSTLNNPNLVVDGRVNSSKNYMASKDILIVPLLSGSGMRVKIIEAMAYGKTVISTTVGVKGIHLENNTNVLIGDTPQEFAAQVIRCIESAELRSTIAINGFNLVNTTYDSGTIKEKTQHFFQDVVNKVREAELVAPKVYYSYAK
ncbi:MAG TPA: glycosyltransferase family 4 protein [Flavobacteriales bacterium]|nr:glycosyltransferase family 4 protein [Flavobacteriales bacterium]